MQSLLTSWIIYNITNSPMMLGWATFALKFPTFILSPIAGAYIDKAPRNKIIKITQTALAIVATVFALLVVYKAIVPWHIIVLNIVCGVIMAFDSPGRQSLLYDTLAHKEDLANGVALVNASRIAGPALAGVIIYTAGEWWSLVCNGALFIVVLALLCLIKINEESRVGSNESIIKTLKDGLSYVKKNTGIKMVLIFIFFIVVATAPVMVLMPLFSRDALSGTAKTMSIITIYIGLGSLVGALFLAQWRNGKIEKMMVPAAVAFGSAITVFALSNTLMTSFITGFISGFSMIVIFAGCNTIIQVLTEDGKRGRVMSLYTTALMGSTPVSSILAGWFADKIGAASTCIAGGMLCILCGIILGLYQKKYQTEQTVQNSIE